MSKYICFVDVVNKSLQVAGSCRARLSGVCSKLVNSFTE